MVQHHNTLQQMDKSLGLVKSLKKSSQRCLFRKLAIIRYKFGEGEQVSKFRDPDRMYAYLQNYNYLLLLLVITEYW